MTTNAMSEKLSHDEAWELLPWFATRNLSAQELTAVEAHLKSCAVCRNEAARCERLSESVKGDSRQAWAPSKAHFASVLANVDAYESKREIVKPKGWFAWLGATPKSARFALALQGACVVALATILMTRGVAPEATYKTLSNPQTQPSNSATRLHIVVSEDISEKELRALLIDVQGQIVAGPSSVGVYTVELTAAQGAVAQALAKLRANKNVRLAEAVPGAGQ